MNTPARMALLEAAGTALASSADYSARASEIRVTVLQKLASNDYGAIPTLMADAAALELAGQAQRTEAAQAIATLYQSEAETIAQAAGTREPTPEP